MPRNKNLTRYTMETLKQIMERDKCKINLNNYKKLTGFSNIDYVCECGENYTKQFKNMLDYGGAFCRGCTRKKSNKKREQTNMEIYGFTNPMQNPIIRSKTNETVKLIYGSNNLMQNAKIAEKQSQNRYNTRPFKFPDGTIIMVQGYEPIALNKLILLGYLKEDIITNKINVPEIWYQNNNSKCRYYCDIYIKSINKIIEVKSDYTYNADIEKNTLKALACINAGYNFEFWIVDKDESHKVILVN
jgi:hypothetical protein